MRSVQRGTIVCPPTRDQGMQAGTGTQWRAAGAERAWPCLSDSRAAAAAHTKNAFESRAQPAITRPSGDSGERAQCEVRRSTGPTDATWLARCHVVCHASPNSKLQRPMPAPASRTPSEVHRWLRVASRAPSEVHRWLRRSVGAGAEGLNPLPDRVALSTHHASMRWPARGIHRPSL